MLISNMHVSDVLGIPCSQHRDYNIELYKLVEVKFLTGHALPAGRSHISYCACRRRCDNLSKLHDFTLHRMLVEVKFLTARALPADGSRISSGLARHFSLIPKHEFMYD